MSTNLRQLTGHTCAMAAMAAMIFCLPCLWPRADFAISSWTPPLMSRIYIDPTTIAVVAKDSRPCAARVCSCRGPKAARIGAKRR
ncbi:hypothetical protein GGI42DRAFT_127789 [Trichoderma sp. SZMC 28013]